MLENRAFGAGVALAVLLLVCAYAVYDPVSCAIKGSKLNGINGYYVATDGLYHKVGYEPWGVPDIFEIIDRRRYADAPSFITMYRQGWYIGTGQTLKYTHPSHQDVDAVVFAPPTNGWGMLAEDNGMKPPPGDTHVTVTHSKGSLDAAPVTPDPRISNLRSWIRLSGEISVIYF